ncbi:hypothetical protein BH18CHL2_BH18CHL2_03550 [soil metagenome]
MPPLNRLAELVFFIALALAYVLAGRYAFQSVGPSGDETYYLMVADALQRGEAFALDVRWSELEGADYSPRVTISRAEFERSTSPSRVSLGRYPLHDVGLSLLLVIPYASGGRELAVALIGIAMAAAVVLSRRTAIAAGATSSEATAAAAGIGLAAPALTYSGQVFPDALAPLAVAIALCALCGRLPRRLIGLGIAALPFLHLRFWPLTLGLLAAQAGAGGSRGRHLLAVALPAVLVMLALTALNLAVYGVALPNAGFYLHFSDGGERVTSYLRPDGAGLPGLFIDRAHGLLPAAPIAVLCFVGAGVAARSPIGRAILGTAVPYVVSCAFLDWTGALSPHARCLAPLIPVLVVFLALALRYRPARLGAVALALWTACQSAIYVQRPELRYPPAGNAYGAPPLADQMWTEFAGFVPGAVFPLLGSGDASTPLLAAGWLTLLVALVALGARGLRQPRPNTRAAAIRSA